MSKETKAEALERFWREWLRDVHHQLAAALADTIGVQPSADDQTRELVEQLIAIEQELA